MIVSGLAAIPPAVAAPLLGDARAALSLMLLTMFSLTVLLTSVAPAVLEIIPNRMQGTMMALYALVITMVGLGLGPLAVAVVSDHILKDEHRLGISLACISFLSVSAAVLAGSLAAKPYSACLEELASSEV